MAAGKTTIGVSGRSTNAWAILCALLAAGALAGCNFGLGGDSSGTGGTTTPTNPGNGGGTPAADYSVGGTISGLSVSGLTLASGNNSVTVAADATSFTLPNQIASGTNYAVNVSAQPQSETCRVSSGNGTIASANVTTVQVTCTVNTYSIGGIVTGLNASGLVLSEGTGSDTVDVAAGASTFLFSTKVAAGGAYAVSVQTQPTGLTCQVLNGSGTMPAAAVNNVIVACGQWTWINGASQVGSAGDYGTQGTTVDSNVPGARAAAAVWIDGSGDLWLFGGSASGGLRNDLWSYSSGEWTWVSGSASLNAAGVYATSSSVPGARAFASSWIDGSGNLWLFGGQGYDSTGASGSLNDLWEYDVSRKTWTWQSGADTAWASGSSPPANEPGGRTGAVAWREGGDLWLFGGTGTQGPVNDLWKYVPSMAQWTLVTGSQTANAFGIYGTRGTAAANNTPGSRTQAVASIDASGNLWLFGGSGYGAIGNPGLLNDLWEFNPGSSQWTWVGGSNIPNAAGIYGTQSATAIPMPGARESAAAATDANGNLWLFGGTGYDGADHQGPLNDLWEYQVASGDWVWMGGSQNSGAAGVYGTEGIGAAADAPGARATAASWMDGFGNFWLFGGQGEDGSGANGLLNDLWQFAP